MLSSVILARAAVECAAMTCFFHEQMKKHFWPKPSDACCRIIDRHKNAARHPTGYKEDDEEKIYHIIDAIKKSNIFAK